MLPHAEHDRVITHDPLAQGTHDVEFMAQGMRGGMSREELVVGVQAGVRQWQRQRERVWVVLDTVHQAAAPGIYFQRGCTSRGRDESADGVAFQDCRAAIDGDKFSLRESALADNVAGLETVTVGVLGKRAGFDFRGEFDGFGDEKLNVCHFEVVEVQEAGVEVPHADIVLESGGSGHGKSREDGVGERGDDVLLFWD